ncbi:acyl-CoA synthetase [Mycobacterium talmoniae]|uniref:Long-chain-fatty-acid--CoA ligase FadD13 n=1 Tax=Mycobacterium talmoniae TaxID=1858794 RepID=A0A1S1NJJ1_9MYCO|nr:MULTISPECIES: acyl-CoA synthetase [Mycobacterium]OHV04026.1 acyl-CoA synthetase [Mycobacterium talmoniae]PQM46085.1 Bile acid-coenzyme A ligase [Mycobacterium talmoniae]TDH49254.1 acyl-CoA synthetase [Mycobacterium eburneum]
MTIGGIIDVVQGTRVLLRSGVADPTRPDQAVRSLLAVRRYGPFAGAVSHAAARYGDAPAIVDERGALSFRQLDGISNALARGLRADGVGPGDVIAALCRDHRGLVLTMMAANKLGARLVLMNTGFAKPQFADVAARERVSVVMMDAEFADLLSAIPAEVPRILTWVDGASPGIKGAKTIDQLIAGRAITGLPAPPKPGGMVLLTSGTTGTPKGAPRDRINPLHSAQLLDRIPLPSRAVCCVAAPLFHGTGLATFTLALALGNTIVLQRRFDPEATLRAVAEHRAHTLIVVPTMLQRIVELAPDVRAQHDTSSVRIIFAAGSALSPDLCRRTAAIFGDVLYNLYGSTEVAVATVATPQELRQAPGTVGRPPVGCRVALYDESRQPITEPGRTGTVFVGSALSFSGYTDGRTKEIMDGLLCTGDLGHVDANGLWFIDGRADDMIVSGGENVFPLEVENLLADRDDVLDAAVIGVDDPEFGQRLRAYIVPAPAAERDAEDIKAYVKANLARYKVPRDIVFVTELPHNATGKLVRARLAELSGDQH